MIIFLSLLITFLSMLIFFTTIFNNKKIDKRNKEIKNNKRKNKNNKKYESAFYEFFNHLKPSKNNKEGEKFYEYFGSVIFNKYKNDDYGNNFNDFLNFFNDENQKLLLNNNLETAELIEILAPIINHNEDKDETVKRFFELKIKNSNTDKKITIINE